MKYLLSVAVGLLIIPLILNSAHATTIDFAGDVGCSSVAQANVKLIAKDGVRYAGAGDYGYGCNETTLTSMWSAVGDKKGSPGNHECQKGQNTKWAASTFGFVDCKNKSKSWKAGNVGIIFINQYATFKPGSKQYTNVVSKSEQFRNDSSIDWIVYVYHEPTRGLGCSKNHCHGDNTSFRSAIDPLVKKYHALTVFGHTHLTGFGSPKGFPTAQCGGGGEDHTKLGSLNGFNYGSSTMGYCKIDFQSKDKAVAEHISWQGQSLHTHTFTR